jgi:hypothetical protein
MQLGTGGFKSLNGSILWDIRLCKRVLKDDKHFSGTRCLYEEWCLLGCYTMWLIRTDVLEELSASIIRMTTIDELGTMLAVTSNQHTLRRNTKSVKSL